MMKKTRLPALLLAGLLFLPGCAAKHTESLLIQDTPRPALETPVPTEAPTDLPANTPEAVPQQESASPGCIAFSQYGKYGLVNSKGGVVLPFEYDEITPSNTEGLFILSRYDRSSEDGGIEYRIAHSGGGLLTDWSPYFPASRRASLLFWDADGVGTVMAAETGESIYTLPFRAEDGRHQASIAGNALLLADTRQGRVDVYSLAALKEGKEEPVFTLSTPIGNGFSLDEIGDRMVVHIYDEQETAYLLDENGRSLGVTHSIIDELYTSDITYTPSTEYMKYSDNGGKSWGILRPEDGKILTEPIFQYVTFVSGDLLRCSVYDGDESSWKVYSLGLGRYLCDDMTWEQMSLGEHGTAYGSTAGGRWYEISEKGARFIAELPGAWNVYELGDFIAINDYRDERRLFMFDRATLQPVQTDSSYRFIDPLYMRQDGRHYFIARKTDWPVYDLLDDRGNVVMKNVRYVTQVTLPYAIVTQGFSTGIVNLETGEWIYKTGTFSYLDD